MAQQGKYSTAQIRAAVSIRKTSFQDFMQKIMHENADDARFFIYIENLLLVIYEHSLSNKYISKSQACRLIPVGHMNTCQRYVEEAERRGFVRFETDETDARRINVIPTEELISYVQTIMEAAIDEARELIGSVSDIKPLPNDNLRLAQFPKHS